MHENELRLWKTGEKNPHWSAGKRQKPGNRESSDNNKPIRRAGILYTKYSSLSDEKFDQLNNQLPLYLILFCGTG